MEKKRKKIEEFDLVLWDLDGTLVDSRTDLVEATNVAMRALGHPPVPFDRFSQMVGQGVRHLVVSALPPGTDPETVEEAIEIFLVWYRRHLADTTRFYPGLREGIARSKALHAVVSNKREDLCRSLLARLGTTDLFARIVGGDTCPERKPHPAPLLAAIEGLGIPRERVLMVGDSAVDIEAGKLAGVTTWGVLWGFGDPASSRPDALLSDPSEVFSPK